METQLDPTNVEAFYGLLMQAFATRAWPLAGAMLLIAGVFLVRKYLGPKYPVLEKGWAAAALTIVSAMAVSVGTALASGVPFTWGLVGGALLAALSAGAFTLGRSLFTAGDAKASITEAQKQGLAAAVVAKAPTSTDVANGP